MKNIMTLSQTYWKEDHWKRYIDYGTKAYQTHHSQKSYMQWLISTNILELEEAIYYNGPKFKLKKYNI
jgi:hypothetical protein